MTRGPMQAHVDVLVEQYADAERGDAFGSYTFRSYNDAIVLAREVRRLRQRLATVPPKFHTFKIEDSDIAAIICATREE